MLKQNVEKPQRHDITMPTAEEINEVVGVPKVITELDDNGRMVSKVVFEATPIEKMNDGLKVDDFALEVLMMNGYVPKRMDFQSHSFEDVDALTEVANSIPNSQEVKDSVKPYVKQED